VNLWATSSARDTDFTAKLVDVHPDGYAQNVLDRLVRAGIGTGRNCSPRSSSGKPTSTTSSSATLPRSSRSDTDPPRDLLVELPALRAHQNTTDDVGTTTEMRNALQTILHDEDIRRTWPCGRAISIPRPGRRGSRIPGPRAAA